MESDILKEVMDYLKECPNIKVWRVNAGTRDYNVKLAPKGIGDIEGFVLGGKRAGRYINFEVKQPKKPLRPSQSDWCRDMCDAGAYYHIVHSRQEAFDVVERYYSD